MGQFKQMDIMTTSERILAHQMHDGTGVVQQHCGDYTAHIKEAAHRVRMYPTSFGRSPRLRCSKCMMPANENGECMNCNTIRITVNA